MRDESMDERPNIYYLRDRWLRGPVTGAELRSLVEAGSLEEGTPVWRSGLQGWATPPGVLLARKDTAALPRDAEAQAAEGEEGGYDGPPLPSPRNLMALRLAKEQDLVTRVQMHRVLGELFASPDPGLDLLSGLQEKGWITASQRATLEAVLDRGSVPKLIAGYEVIRELGRGGMGTTYLARQISMDRLVALKVLLPRYSQDEEYIRRFEREAKMAARLNHEVIATAYEVGEVGGQHFLSMEYAPGSTVGAMIEEKGAFPEKEIVRMVVEVCRALQHAHEHEMVHRDVKPDNIIVKPNGHVKLVDMGLARSTTHGGSSLTDVGLVVCTPDYASPEQGQGMKNLDIRSDIYSLGCVFYEMLTASAPFQGSTPMATVNMHINDPLPPVSGLRPDASELVCRVVERMTAKRPEDRHQTPKEVIEELTSGTGPLRARPATTRAVRPVAAQLASWEGKDDVEVILLPEWREYVHLIALKLDARLEKAGVDPEFQGYAQTVFTELVSNAFDHGCKDVTEGVIRLRMELNPAFFSLEVEDPGPGFPAKETLARIKKEPLRRQRRRGIMQVAGIADALTYSPKGNSVKAILYRKSEGSGIFTREAEDITFVEIKGKGDLALVESFRRWVATYDANTPRRVCLMLRTKWVSSLFVGTIATLGSKLTSAGSALSVWVEHQGCYRIVQSLGITVVVHAYTSLDQAKLALRYATIGKSGSAAATDEKPAEGPERDLTAPQAERGPASGSGSGDTRHGRAAALGGKDTRHGRKRRPKTRRRKSSGVLAWLRGLFGGSRDRPSN
jgi:serine/threonine-protein kinase